MSRSGYATENPRLTAMLGLTVNDKAAIIGCGGKTSLLYRLAEENRKASVLIGTTTRIWRPAPQIYDYETDSGSVTARPGVTLISGGEADGKLFPPPKEELACAGQHFDYTFLECDGSKTLPLKGWADNEPVIPEFVTATIGICVVWPIGMPLSEKNALRMSQFCEITGAMPGDTIKPAHIAAMISHPFGMMRRSTGKNILLFNQIESAKARERAIQIVGLLPESFLKSLSRILAGSLRLNNFEVILEA